jgi:hypothetical protein
MEAKRLDVKLFAQRCEGVKPSDLIAIFHGFIQRGAIEGELLIDVADYSHVVGGPGVVLVGHEAHYGFEQHAGRAALLHSQRRARIEGGFAEALRYGVRQALRAASLLHQEQSLRGKLRFAGQELLVRINDRLAAPNTAETFRRVEPEARGVLLGLLGPDATLAPEPPSAELFAFRARAAAPVSIDSLLARLE